MGQARGSVPARVALGLLAALLLLLAPTANAQDDGGGGGSFSSDWTLLDSYQDAAHALTVLPQGTVLARGDQGLYRSEDNGDTWALLANPPDGTTIAADPADDQVLYGYGAAGLERSADGGGTWQVIRPAPASPPRPGPPPFAIGADHQELFLAEGETIQRSPDAGASWQQVYAVSHAGSPCTASITQLIPHPTDPRRLATDAGCYAGRDLGTGLIQTRDGGSTWSVLVPTGRGAYPCTLVGGQGAQPTRWYLVASPFMQAGGGVVLRSDDDGATWNMVLRTEPTVQRLCGVAYDPTQPDMVWVAASQTPDPAVTGVRASADGGQTWGYLGRQDIGWVNALARAADGSALFAATNEGVWRLVF
jgi:photosystem II stability/assembly factor-like uncharacterized protein